MSENNRVHVYCRVSIAGQEDNYSLDTQEAACRAWAAERGLVRRLRRARGLVRGGPPPARSSSLLDGSAGRYVLCYASTGSRARRWTPRSSLTASNRPARRSRSSPRISRSRRPAPSCAARKRLPPSWSARRSPSAPSAVGARASPVASRSRTESAVRLPLGRRREDASSILDPETAPVVRLIFDLALAGVSLRQISKRLAEQGIPRRTGRPRWQPSSIREILLPTDVHRHGGDVRDEARAAAELALCRGARTARSGWCCPASRSRSSRPRNRRRSWRGLRRTRRHSTRRNPHPERSLLRAGYIACGHCGWALTVSNATPASRRLSPQYRCTAKRQHGRPARDRRITASMVDRDGLGAGREILRDPADHRRRSRASAARTAGSTATWRQSRSDRGAIADKQAQDRQALADDRRRRRRGPAAGRTARRSAPRSGGRAERDDLAAADRGPRRAKMQRARRWATGAHAWRRISTR